MADLDTTCPLNVLAVDADENSLLDVEKVLQECNLTVTKCRDAEQCLSMVRERQVKFHLVIIDVCTPKIDGYELCRLVREESDVPIVLMSSTYSNADTVKKALDHGACDFLLKPIKAEHLRKIDLDAHNNCALIIKKERSHGEEEQEVSATTTNSEQDGLLEKRKGDSITGLDPPTRKKQRVIWYKELHETFLEAVNKYGLECAVPKKIMEVMNIPGLTRENVASHLQKYRQQLKKQQENSQEKQQRRQKQQQQQEEEQHQCESNEVTPDNDVTKTHLPVSALTHQRAVDEPIIRSEHKYFDFKMGSHQVLGWTDPTVQQPGFQGPFICNTNNGTFGQTGYYIDANDVNHSMDQLPNETHGLLNYSADIPQYETGLSGLSLTSKIQLGYDPLDVQIEGNYNNYVASIHQGEQHNLNAAFNVYPLDPHQPQNMINSSCYDQYNQGGLVTGIVAYETGQGWPMSTYETGQGWPMSTYETGQGWPMSTYETGQGGAIAYQADPMNQDNSNTDEFDLKDYIP